MEPRMVGRYQIRSELARGGMATVYLALDPRFNRQVAVKILPPQFTHDPMFRARFDREAQVIASNIDVAFVIDNCDFSVTMGESSFRNKPHHELVVETRTGETRTLKRGQTPKRGAGSAVALFGSRGRR